MNNLIADLRQEYASRNLHESEMAPNPVSQFEKWWGEALESAIIEPNAMTLATASSDEMHKAENSFTERVSQLDLFFIPTIKVTRAFNWKKTRKHAWYFYGKNWKDRCGSPVWCGKLMQRKVMIISSAGPKAARSAHGHRRKAR